MTNNPLDENADQYASVEESRAAIVSLTNEDYLKLMVIAGYFCRSRGLRSAQLEPDELLGESISRTLSGDRKWRKSRVTIIRHLDRCMESISGHTVEDEVSRMELKEAILAEEFDQHKDSPRTVQRADAEKQLLASDELSEIEALFADSPVVLSVLRAKAQGYTESEITLKLGIGKKGYEAARKRIERVLAPYLKDRRK